MTPRDLLLEMLNEIERLNIENCKLRILWKSFDPHVGNPSALDDQLEEMPLVWDMPRDVGSQFAGVREHIHQENVREAHLALLHALSAVRRLH
jgi:hypothetical protein